MKKWLCLLGCGLLLMVLSACGGNVRRAATHEVPSAMYAQEEILSAMNVIKREFRREWDGCTLKELYYAGDEYTRRYQEWADRHGADEVIVLLSTFDVDASGGDGSLNPNSTYRKWNWILVRQKGGSWVHVDHGY